MAINANSGEYKSRIGLDSLYIAEVTQDDVNGYAADTPEYFAPAAEGSQEPSSSSEIQYADDLPFDIADSEGPTKITLKVTGMPLEMQAKVLGLTFDATAGRMYDDGGVPPFIALSGRSLKSNGHYRYFQFLKGKFSRPKEESVTRGEKAEPKTQDLEYTAIFSTYKFTVAVGKTRSLKRISGDDDTTNFSATSWFSQVQVPSVSAPSALALSSSVPTDGATGISVSANQTLTFNNMLPANAVNNVILVTATGAVKVAAVVTIDTARKVITINPNASLDASTDYIITYAMTDVYGQTLSGAINFTTDA